MFANLRKKYKRHIDSTSYWRLEGAVIGNGVEINPTAELGSEPYLIEIGDDVRITAGVVFDTHDGGCWVIRRLREELSDVDRFGRIKIGNNVHIGINSIILPGVTIGNNVIIGCGSIVTKDVPDNSVVAGVPAKVIETVDEYIQKHINDFEHTKSMTSSEKKDYLLNRRKK